MICGQLRHAWVVGMHGLAGARKRPHIFKALRAVRRNRDILRSMGGFIAFVAFAVFVVWDIRNLANEEPVESRSGKTIRDDPGAALSDARGELARVMKEEGARCL